MTPRQISKKLYAALDELKAVDIQVLDVQNLTSITDIMIIASGRSGRQVKALAEKVIETSKELGMPPLGVEGERQAEWILVDIGDVVAHLMHPVTRDYYQLEKLWLAEDRQIISFK
ncbi:MAG: ribosome silencing factor [Gammaproteobacteria bacterium]